jgi:hypothetical protein
MGRGSGSRLCDVEPSGTQDPWADQGCRAMTLTSPKGSGRAFCRAGLKVGQKGAGAWSLGLEGS